MPRKLQPLFGCAKTVQFGNILNQRQKIEIDDFQRQFLRFDLGEIENVVDDRQQRLGAGADDVQVALLLAVQRCIEQQGRHAHNAVHRRTDFVRHHGQEGRFCLIGRFRLFPGGDQILLDADAPGDVTEAKNASDDAFVKVLRQGLALENPTVRQLEQVFAFLLVDNLAQTAGKGRAVLCLRAHVTEDGLIVLTEQKVFGKLPH